MSDIENSDNVDFDDINFDEFENFANSDEFKDMFTAEGNGENLPNEQIADDPMISTTGDFSGDFSFDAIGEGEVYVDDQARQEPYFEAVPETADEMNNEFAQDFAENSETAQEEKFFDNANSENDEQYLENNDDFYANVDTPVIETSGEAIEQEYLTQEYELPSDMEVPVEDVMQPQEVSTIEDIESPQDIEVSVEEDMSQPQEVSIVEDIESPQAIDTLSDIEDDTVVEPQETMVEEQKVVEDIASVEAEVAYDGANNFSDDTNNVNVGAFSVVAPENMKYLKWYSGSSADEVYEFGKSSASAEFEGTSTCKTIHVNIGYDSYGWVVQFADGVVMSLRDVKEYQIRNGRLPNSSGRIVYGQTSLSFERVERIVIYEAVKYFSYGA